MGVAIFVGGAEAGARHIGPRTDKAVDPYYTRVQPLRWMERIDYSVLNDGDPGVMYLDTWAG